MNRIIMNKHFNSYINNNLTSGKMGILHIKNCTK